MKKNQLAALLITAILLFNCNGDKKIPATEMPAAKLRLQIIEPEALNILDSAAKIEVIASGFKWTEGPVYIAGGDYLIFSDIPDNKIYKWKEGEGASTYLAPSGNTGNPKPIKEPGSNGLLLDRTAHLILCQHGDRRVAKMVSPLNNPKPEFVTLADNFKGRRLNSPNDAVLHPNGDMYFTDPPYGLGNGVADSLKELDFQGVYRLKPTGELNLFTKKLKYPNGLALSPDAKFLFVASSDSLNFLWMRYELDADGLVKSEQVFYTAHEYEGKNLGSPDGMKINKEGYLFATGPGGVWLFNPAGKVIARIYTGELTSNCAFGPGEKVLFMTCDDYVMRLKLKGE